MVHLQSLFVTLLALAATPLAAVAKGIQPPAELVRARPTSARVHTSRDNIALERVTNAKRLAQGLPPLPPRAVRRGTPTVEARHNRPKPSPSSAPGHTVSGYIVATDSRTGKFIGYVGKQYQIFGEYGAVIKHGDALKVAVKGVKWWGETGPVEIHQTNGDKVFTAVGAISGFASDSEDLLPGSSSYLYIGGTSSTAPLAPPTKADNAFTDDTSLEEAVESAIWHYNAVTRKVTAEWINTDGTPAKTQLAYYPDDNVFIAVGDLAAFKAEFGDAQPVTFVLVPH